MSPAPKPPTFHGHPIHVAPLTPAAAIMPDPRLLRFYLAVEWRRKQKGISVTRLAAATKNHRGRLAEWLKTGEPTPSIDGLERLMHALGMTINYEKSWQPGPDLQPRKPGRTPKKRHGDQEPVQRPSQG